MSTILITDLTNATTVASGASNGTGIFDKLMNSTVLYLDDQYTTGRIKGTDYANVLLGSIQAVLQQSVHLLLQKDMIAAQIEGVSNDNLVKAQQVLESVYKVENMLPKELEKLEAEVDLINKEKDLKVVDTVIKDKTCAALGLDNVMKNVNDAKNSTVDYVYTPKYLQ